MKVILTFLMLGLISYHAVAGDNSINGYKPKDIGAAKLLDLDNSLKHHSGNIITIRQELITKAPANQQTSKEGEYSDAVLFELSEINNDVEDLIAKQNLLGAMESNQGKNMVVAHKKGDMKSFKEKCGSYLAGLNSNLSKISDGALIFEVKSARDDVVNICDIVKNWD